MAQPPQSAPESAALRRLFDPADLPGLGPVVRPGALSVGGVRELVEETLLGLPGAERSGLAHDRLLALALCWHDRWDEAHGLCVAHEGDQDSDLVHQVLHRREPDADNCRYWIRQTGWHPVYDQLPPLTQAAANRPAGIGAGRWDPELFMVRCHAADATTRPALERIQAGELTALRHRLLAASPR